MAAREPRRRSWLARGVRLVVIALVVLPLVYLGAGNAFLALGGIDAMFAGTNTVSAKYRSAYTLWPGRVHVRELRIVFQDYNLQWSLDFEKVTADLRLTELVRRTFHATRVVASGGVFRMRHRIEPESKGEPWVQALAPIPEFRSPAVFEARVPEPPIPDDKYNLWTVHLENVDAGVKELWVHFIRYRGAGRARGAFELVPARRLWVSPASLELAPGPLRLGDDELSAALSGHIECVVDPFDVRVPVGREVLRFINTDMKLLGRGFRPEALLKLFELRSQLALRTEQGDLEVAVALKRGHLQQGSHVSLAARTASAELANHRAVARAKGLRVVARMAPEARGELEVAAARAELARELGTRPSIEMSEPRAHLLTRGDDMAGEFELVGRGVDLPSLKVADARALNDFMGSPRRRFVGGRLEGSLSASEMGSERRAEMAVKAHELGAEWDGSALALSGALRGRGAMAGESLPSLELTLSGEVGRMRWNRRGLASRPPLLLELRAARLEGDLTRKREGRSRGKLKVEADSLVARTTFADGEGAARFRRVSLEASGHELGAPRWSGELRFAAERGDLTGGSRAIRLKPELRLRAEALDLAGQSGRIASALSLTDLVATHGDPTGQCSTFRAAEARLTVDGDAARGILNGRAALELTRARFDWGDFEASASARILLTLKELGLASGAGRVTAIADVTEASLRSGNGPSTGWLATASKLTTQLDAWTGRALLGSLTIDAPDVRGRIGGTRLRSSFVGTLPVLSADLAERTARFDGELRLTRTEVFAERPVRDWWARIQVRSGLVSARQNIDANAIFSARLRDVSPGVAILDQGGGLPGWLAGLAPTDPVNAEGMLKRRCRLTEIQLTRAEDGPLSLRGRLQSVPAAVRGAFLVRLGPAKLLSAGVAFDPTDTDVSLLAGDGWFHEQSDALDRAARHSLDRPCVVPDSSCGVD